MHPVDDQCLEVDELVLLRHDQQRGQHGRGVLDGRVESQGVEVLDEGEDDRVRLCTEDDDRRDCGRRSGCLPRR